MRTRLLFAVGLSAISLMGLALAQQAPTLTDEEPQNQPNQALPPPPPPRRHPPNPLIVALDVDKNGIISAEEIAGASEALLTLDTDGDGALTLKEMRPPRPEPPEDAQPGEHIMRLDTNEDGIVTFEEFTAPLSEPFSKIDTNGDGNINADEAAAAPPPPPPPHRRRPGGPPQTGEQPPGNPRSGTSNTERPPARPLRGYR